MRLPKKQRPLNVVRLTTSNTIKQPTADGVFNHLSFCRPLFLFVALNPTLMFSAFSVVVILSTFNSIFYSLSFHRSSHYSSYLHSLLR